MQKIKQKIDEFIDKNITDSALSEIFSDRFARYAKYIIQDRAIPDVRDGLKPVQRRILYAMYKMGVFSEKPYRKSARITGEVMGKYHPHGDSSIYEAMVRMSQDFKMNIPLIDMHGNNGSIDGDSPAAMRYTEARLAFAAETMLTDLDKKTVVFIPNFDDEEIEPVVLPARFPNLLVNGSSGISAGYATKIPPHNIGEIIDATLHLLNHPKAGLEKILEIVKGPDFPTGGIVEGKDSIVQALATGTGRILLKSKIEIEQINANTKRIVVTEIPFEVSKADLVREIDTTRIEKGIDIQEVRDESDKEGLRIAIDLKANTDPTAILAYLFKNTQLQVYFNYNMVSIANSRPVCMGIIDILLAYINHYKECYTARTEYLCDKDKERLHIVEGLEKMLSVLDEIIRIIRASHDKKSSIENIVAGFNGMFTVKQATAIVNMRLYRLSNTDIVLLLKEKDDLIERIKEYEKILADPEYLTKKVGNELKETKKQLFVERRTEIKEEITNLKIDEKALISNDTYHFGVSANGYIYKSSLKSFAQSKQTQFKTGDSLVLEQDVSNHSTFLMFTNQGNFIAVPIYKIGEKKWSDLGIHIGQIVELAEQERVIFPFIIDDYSKNLKFLLATKQGFAKQALLTDLTTTRFSKPQRAIKLAAKDELISVSAGPLKSILCITKKGYGLCFSEAEVPEYGLYASGVRVIKLEDKDELASALFVDEESQIMMLTNKATVFVRNYFELPQMQRYRKGSLLYQRQKTQPAEVVSAVAFNSSERDLEASIFFKEVMLTKRISDLKNTNKFGLNLEGVSKESLPWLLSLKTNLLANLKPGKVSETLELVKIKKKATKISEQALSDFTAEFGLDEPKKPEETKEEPVYSSPFFDELEF